MVRKVEESRASPRHARGKYSRERERARTRPELPRGYIILRCAELCAVSQRERKSSPQELCVSYIAHVQRPYRNTERALSDVNFALATNTSVHFTKSPLQYYRNSCK